MTDMSAYKVSGIFALVSVLSLAGAFIRGDLVCAGTFTAILILIFFLSCVAAVIALIAAFIGAIRRSHSNVEPKPN
ncbi:MAG TPA: hypothetical protein VNY78_09470 [Edaphobacter sp.]|jgi:hypothetical protein|nr:hypothetical protein [Edaphobacter sp.]